MELLLISNENKSHYVYIKDFNKFMCNKTKNENKKYFCNYCLQQCFSREKVFQEHKENGLIINGKQTVKLKSGSNRFKNCFKQLAIPFTIYADFECLLKGVQSIDRNNNTLKNIKITFFVVLLIKLFVLIINSVKKLFFTEEKMQSIDSLKQFLKSMIIAESNKKTF